MTDAREFQPYYVAYAKAHNRTPEEMLAHDRQRSRGGTSMVGYIIWIGEQWAQWRALRGVRGGAPLSQAQRDDFGEWLQLAHNHNP